MTLLERFKTPNAPFDWSWPWRYLLVVLVCIAAAIALILPIGHSNGPTATNWVLAGCAALYAVVLGWELALSALGVGIVYLLFHGASKTDIIMMFGAGLAVYVIGLLRETKQEVRSLRSELSALIEGVKSRD